MKKKIILNTLLMLSFSTFAQVDFDMDFCRFRTAGLYPHPEACNAVYICEKSYSSESSLVFCPSGTIWNDYTQQCDIPSNVAPPCGTAGESGH